MPADFTRTITEAHGENGADWLFARLPKLVGELENRWRIRVEKPFENLSSHWVAPCRFVADGGAAVLKIGFPAADSPIAGEARMLRLLDGRGAVKLLKTDAERHALLIERAAPGATLKTVFRLEPARAVEAAIRVLRQIRLLPPARHNFVLLDDWFKDLEKAADTDFPATAAREVLDLYRKLKTERSSLLHADFHHENVLSAGREPFLAIDLKGVVGNIGYDIAVFLNNHSRWLESAPDLREQLNVAVDRFAAAFGIEPQNLREWAFAQAVLSARWTQQDNGQDWRNDLNRARIWRV